MTALPSAVLRSSLSARPFLCLKDRVFTADEEAVSTSCAIREGVEGPKVDPLLYIFQERRGIYTP